MNVLISLTLLGIISLFAGITAWRNKIFTLVLCGIGGVFLLNISAFSNVNSYFKDMLMFDNYAVVFIGLVLFISFLIVLLSKNRFAYDEANTGDYYGIIIFTLAGAVMMISYSNLVMLFVGIETLSISLYVLAGSRKNNLASNEAALKYFIMGAFATCILLLGMVLIYGITGSFRLEEIAEFLNNNGGNFSLLLSGGILLIMIGLLFKVSAAPFHFWAPDVYEGSPNIITLLMATVVKIAAFAGFFRLFISCFSGVSNYWKDVLSVVIVLTLIIGHFAALRQSNLKRFITYSGIAHVGYMLLTIITLNENSSNALFYYLLSYSLASIGAFIMVMILAEEENPVDSKSLKGIARKNPMVALFFTVTLLSLAGIPPMSGFFAKYYIFSEALKNGYIGLVLIAVITALVGIYYYFRIIADMYSTKTNEKTLNISPIQKNVLAVCSALSLLAGIFPDIILNLL